MLPSHYPQHFTVLQRLVYSAVFTARLVGYLNCDRGGGGGAVLLGKFQWSVQPRSFLEPVPYCISQTKNNMCPVSGLSDLNLFTRKRHVIFKPCSFREHKFKTLSYSRRLKSIPRDCLPNCRLKRTTTVHNTTISLNLKKGSRPFIRVSVAAKHIELKSLKDWAPSSANSIKPLNKEG